MAKTTRVPYFDDVLSPKHLSKHKSLTYEDALEGISLSGYRAILTKSIDVFEKQRISLAKAIDSAHNVFLKQPILTAILLWSKVDDIGNKGNSGRAKVIIDHALIPFVDREGKLLLIREIKHAQSMQALELIRCRTEFSLLERESLVETVVHFFEWAFQTTCGAVPRVYDPDASKVWARTMDLPVFVSFSAALEDRYRLVAKLLYFGGSRTLDEVLNLKVEDVCFDEQVIIFGTQKILYPVHTIRDIKNLLGNRSSGRIFVGKNDVPINPATIFRNFKEAASKVGLGESFSSKELTSNE